MEPIELESQGTELTVYNSQPVRMQYDGIEFLHAGGLHELDRTEAENQRIARGAWKNSMISMFPNIGRLVDDTLMYRGERYHVTPHGMPRALDYSVCNPPSDQLVLYDQIYIGERDVQNPKDPDGEPISLPFSYRLETGFIINSDGFMMPQTLTNLSGSVAIEGDFGIHPAVLVSHAEDIFTTERGDVYTLEEVIEASKSIGALQINGATEVTYRSHLDGRELMLRSFGFNNAMLWCPGEVGKDGRVDVEMACIEFLTRLPKDADKANYLDGASLYVEPKEDKDFYTVFKVRNT